MLSLNRPKFHSLKYIEAFCIMSFHAGKQSTSFRQLSFLLPENNCVKLGFHARAACRIHSPRINSESGHSEGPKNRSVFE